MFQKTINKSLSCSHSSRFLSPALYPSIRAFQIKSLYNKFNILLLSSLLFLLLCYKSYLIFDAERKAIKLTFI